MTKRKAHLFLVMFVVATVILYLAYQNNQLKKQEIVLMGNVATLKEELKDVKAEYASTTRQLGEAIETLQVDLTQTEGDYDAANQKFKDTVTVLQSTQQNLSQTRDELIVEQEKTGIIEGQIKSITETVDTLVKLSQTDEELLQKYSKVYFLNEHYTPAKLTKIDQGYVYPNKDLYIRTDVFPYLQELLEGAVSDGIGLFIVSAYRSFDTQAEIKSSYTIIYGVGTANQFSADQGYSEHQLGATVDITTANVGATYTGFEDTKGFEWLQGNAYLYGFILSYPKDNAYYKFEPWHWRFVGKALAKKIHDEDVSFYDLNQRDIDAYLIYIFD